MSSICFSGGTDKLTWTTYAEDDVTIMGLSLDITNQTTMTPVYYVSVKAENGAKLYSSPVTSTPVVVVPEDAAGEFLFKLLFNFFIMMIEVFLFVPFPL